MKTEEKLTIEVQGADVDNFKSAVKKLTTEICQVGLKNNTITKDEHDVFVKLNESLNK